MRNKISLIGLVLCFSLSLHAQMHFNQRDIVLLPITDGMKGTVSYNLFQSLERYLQNTDWCHYKSNSEIINILSHYRDNMRVHLSNDKVLSAIADRVKAGSLIRILLDPFQKGVKIKIDILGGNGRDLYFQESIDLNTLDPDIMTRTIANWLTEYEKTIPYQGQVTGLLGDQFVTDIGKMFGVNEGQKLKVLRPINKKSHPLLKQIVDWNYKKIGEAVITGVESNQSKGKLTKLEPAQRPQLGDWIQFVNQDSGRLSQIEKVKADDDNASDYSFGKLGVIGLYGVLGSGSVTSSGSTTNKVGGILMGGAIKAELWATRHWWTSLEIDKRFASYKVSEGSSSLSSNSADVSITRFKIGYRYLPLGFFYGPQVDAYAGYGKYNFSMDGDVANGLVGSSFKGLLLGFRGSMPIYQNFRIGLELEFFLNPGYEEETLLHEKDDSASAYTFLLGGSYLYTPKISYELYFGTEGARAKFDGQTYNQLKNQNTYLKGGVVFSY